MLLDLTAEAIILIKNFGFVVKILFLGQILFRINPASALKLTSHSRGRHSGICPVCRLTAQVSLDDAHARLLLDRCSIALLSELKGGLRQA